MDVWVVAAAAGAGYVAQRLKNLTSGKHGWLDSPSCKILGHGSNENIEVQAKSYHLHRFSGKSSAIDLSREREQAFQEASAEMAFTSKFDGENLQVLENYANSSAVLISNSSNLNNEDIQGDIDSVGARDSVPQPSSREMGVCYGLRRNRSSLRSKHLKSQFIKPRTSLESCLIAQLYREHAGIEEYTYYERPPSKPTVGPFLVSDGNRIISRKSRDSLLTEAENHKLEKDKCVFGVPKLPDVVNVELQKKVKVKTGKQQVLRSESCEMGNRDHSNAQGSSHGAFRFYLGLTTGIITAFLANKWETEKLNKLLKQNENLVQDLQEELEMKDSLTVKELAMEDYESHDLHNSSNGDDALGSLSLEQKLSNSTIDYREELCDQKPEEESMSKIEAELEAELERLESNINSSKLERKISNMAELNPDFDSDVTMGDLRADLFGAKNGNQLYKNKSCSSTPHSALYPVDPRELSLRLHVVVQSRLEERVKELETVLHNSQSKVMEFPKMPPMEFPIDKMTRNFEDDVRQSLDQHVLVNLSGEALSAYSEAFDAFSKLSDSDEENSRLGFETSEHQENFHRCKEFIDRVHNGRFNGDVARSVSDGTPQTEISCGVGGDCYADGDENVDSDDEMERWLIRQIVEKARQGSPAVLKAQRALLLNDEIEC